MDNEKELIQACAEVIVNTIENPDELFYTEQGKRIYQKAKPIAEGLKKVNNIMRQKSPFAKLQAIRFIKKLNDEGIDIKYEWE